MFARNVAIHLKPNALGEFTRIFDNEVLPILRKQTGFQDEITFSTTPTGMDVIAISLWDTREHAEAYNATGYPEVLKSLNKVLDGAPRVRVSDVISSTLHKTAVSVAA
jgi:heme-degrading monooxygenase HmoA